MTEIPSTIEWRVSDHPVDYPAALSTMEQRVEDITAGAGQELFWLLEHPPLYTAGSSATPDEISNPDQFPVYDVGRGGRYTYHGPGQRVLYAVCDLRKRGRDVRQHVWRLEEWVIRVLADFGVKGERREGRIGIWVVTPSGQEEKIAAIGVRVRHWVAFHGLALNVAPNLSHFGGIVPCGLAEFGVTSLDKLGIKVSMAEVDARFKAHWAEMFPEV